MSVKAMNTRVYCPYGLFYPIKEACAELQCEYYEYCWRTAR